MDNLIIEKRSGVLHIVLARPDKHNAFDGAMIAELTQALHDVENDDAIRAVVLSAKGKSFSAGADLDWMRSASTKSRKENHSDARALALLMRTLNTCSRPTVAAVQGATFGGGVGLVACCDIAIASEEARFALSEVKIGLIPAAISPYVVAAIGRRQAHRYFLTGETFDARTAERIGLVHEVSAPEALDHRIGDILDSLLKTAPRAVRASKQLIADVADRPIDDEIVEMTADRIATIRVGAEAREGLAAFFERRLPGWSARGGE